MQFILTVVAFFYFFTGVAQAAPTGTAVTSTLGPVNTNRALSDCGTEDTVPCHITETHPSTDVIAASESEGELSSSQAGTPPTTQCTTAGSMSCNIVKTPSAENLIAVPETEDGDFGTLCGVAGSKSCNISS